MPRFLKSKRLAEIPAPSPTSPADLVRDLTSRRDSGALAASSTAIALSIRSAFSDTRDAPSDSVTARGRNTGWETAYAAVRMAVETAKESSDLCLPLKAVVGAISILMKNYDVSAPCLRTEHILILHPFPLQQTSDNVDGVKGIKRRVQSLSSVLASPVGEDDYTEKGRRAELRRSVLSHTNICWFAYPSLSKLKGVIAKLEPLTEQHVLVGFLCNVDNAKTLAGFAQELADAIMDYQV